MAQLRIDFQGCGNVEAPSWARIQPMRHGAELALRVPRHLRTLGQVLAPQPIGVLGRAALLGAMRIGKEDANGQSRGQPLVLCHRFALQCFFTT